ncbi:MAG: hypothetical protein SPH30_03635 [Prevotella sp.]|nr:hypothetical protein [Prevotella sp.]
MKRATICTLLFFFCLCNIYVTAQVRKSPNYDGYWDKSAKVYKNPASKFYWDLSDFDWVVADKSIRPKNNVFTAKLLVEGIVGGLTVQLNSFPKGNVTEENMWDNMDSFLQGFMDESKNLEESQSGFKCGKPEVSNCYFIGHKAKEFTATIEYNDSRYSSEPIIYKVYGYIYLSGNRVLQPMLMGFQEFFEDTDIDFKTYFFNKISSFDPTKWQ